MSNYSSTILPDLSPPRTFSIAFRPHVQPSIPETTPRQELPSIPLDNEMVDFEPGEINIEEHECENHTSESFSQQSTSDDRDRSRSPRQERRDKDRYRHRSRSSSSSRGRSRRYRGRSSRRGHRPSVVDDSSSSQDRPRFSSSPKLHPTGGWEADFWPPLRSTSPRSRGVRVSDSYRPPQKTWIELVEERSRAIALREAGVPDAPKALSMTWAERVEARAKAISLIPEGAPQGPRNSEVHWMKQNDNLERSQPEGPPTDREVTSNLDNAPKKQGLDRWFPGRLAESGRRRGAPAVAFHEGGLGYGTLRTWRKGDSVMTLNYDDPVSSTLPPSDHVPGDYGRLSRPCSPDGQDEEMVDAPTIEHPSNIPNSAILSARLQAADDPPGEYSVAKVIEQTSTANETRSHVQPVQRRTAITQLQSWISDQPPTPTRPLATVTRQYNIRCIQEMGGFQTQGQQKSASITKDKMKTDATPSTPACLLPPPCYPEEPLDYD